MVQTEHTLPVHSLPHFSQFIFSLEFELEFFITSDTLIIESTARSEIE